MSMVTGVSPAAAPEDAVRAVELAIGGMTCASCAARVEKKLSRLNGVTAMVNFATGTARVRFPAAMPATDLVSVVEQAGYTAALPAPPGEPGGGAAEEDGAGEASGLRKRLLVSLALAIPVVALAMIPPLQFRNWQWACLALASPVAVWGAWPFHRAAVINGRHGAATMDTLVSVGVTAAYLWSVYTLFFGDAGRGLRPVLLTGDNNRAARSVADAVGISEVIAGVLPAGKLEAVRRLQEEGRVVAMAGDGVNDAAALAQADLGLAMGTGTDAAIQASDLTLVRGDLLAIPDAILLSRRTLATIKANLF